MEITNNYSFFISCLTLIGLYFSVSLIKDIVDFVEVLLQYVVSRLEIDIQKRTSDIDNEEEDKSSESVNCIGFLYDNADTEDEE